MPIFSASLGQQYLSRFGPLLALRIYSPRDQSLYWDGLGLVDTGATKTCLSDRVAKSLGYAPVDRVKCTDSSGSSIKPVYSITFEFLRSNIPPLVNWSSVGADLSGWHSAFLMLIGRDILANGELTYNGPTGSWSLEIPARPRDVKKELDKKVASLRKAKKAASPSQAKREKIRAKRKRKKKHHK